MNNELTKEKKETLYGNKKDREGLDSLNTISIKNPLKEDFSCRYNGELYTLKTKEEKSYPLFLALHIAKKLSDLILSDEAKKIKVGVKPTDNPFNPAKVQFVNYDNPRRRIILYDLLGDKNIVEKCIKSFNFKDFIGDISEYDDYVAKAEAPEAPKSSGTTTPPPAGD